MNFPGNFKKIADVSIDMLKDLVLQLTPEHWTGDTTRQQRYEAHRDTQTIGLVYDEDFRHTNPTKLPPLELFSPALRQILTVIADFYEAPAEEAALWQGFGAGYFIRTTLVSLRPGGEIVPHQDKNFSLAHSHRVHVPVVTNDKVLFTVGNETICMQEGEIMEVNNRRLHSVSNGGNESRIHLILDWVNPSEYCCCSAKTHPGIPCSPEECVATDRMNIPCECYPENSVMQHAPAQEGLRQLAGNASSTYSATDIESLLEAPTIIVSAPRSGSNLLFEQMTACPGIWTIGGESHEIFRAFPHLQAENPAFDSGSLDETHADEEVTQELRRCFLFLLRDHRGNPFMRLPISDRPARVCLLEKTPRNALNIPFLLRVFPRAKFIYLHRDPRQAVASLIEAWTLGLQTGRFVTFPELPGWDRRAWCFLLPPGWREMRGKSLAEIAAFQWLASNKIIMDGLSALPAERWLSVTYDALLAEPESVLARLARFCGTDGAFGQLTAGSLPLSSTTLTPPHPDKWKRHEQEIGALSLELSAMAEHINVFCTNSAGGSKC